MEEPTVSAPNVSVAGLHVLIAEDVELNAEVLEDLLEMEEITSEWAENGKRAVEMFRESEAGHFNVILMDMRMPVMDGITATKEIRKLDRPDAEKILIICEQLDVTPYELLSGTDGAGKRSNPSDTRIIRKDSDLGRLVVDYLAMDQTMQGRLQGYMQALKEINEGSAGVKDHI